MKPTFLAAIDLGSGSLKLKIVSVVDLKRPYFNTELKIRIPYHLDRQKAFQTQDHLVLLAGAKAVTSLLQAFGVQTYAAGATSFYRDYVDGNDLLSWLKQESGLCIPLLTGEEEAKYIFHAVQKSFPQRKKLRYVIDIGGGSTEVVLNIAGGSLKKYESAKLFSFPIGAVRLLKSPAPNLMLAEWASFCSQNLAPTLATEELEMVVLGGGAEIIASYVKPSSDGTLAWDKVEKFVANAQKLSIKALSTRFAMPVDKVPLLPYFIQIATIAVQVTGVRHIYTPNLSLVDGLLYQAWRKLG